MIDLIDYQMTGDPDKVSAYSGGEGITFHWPAVQGGSGGGFQSNNLIISLFYLSIQAVPQLQLTSSVIQYVISRCKKRI